MSPDAEAVRFSVTETPVTRPEPARSDAGAEEPQSGPSWGRTLRRIAGVMAPMAILAAPVLVIGLCFWPGHMNADTLYQIQQAISGDVNNRHAPLLVALWSVGWDLGMGPGWILVGQTVCFMAGAYLILRAIFGRIAAALVAAAIALSPPVFGMLALVGRDIWFTAFLLLAFGFLVRATQRPWPVRGRWLAAAAAAAWLALAARQNAAVSVVIVCVGIAGLLVARRRGNRGDLGDAPAEHGRPLRTAITATAAGVALTAVLVLTQVAASAAIGVRDVQPEQYLFIYDVAAISVREDENLLPADVMPIRDPRVLEQRFSVDVVNTLILTVPPLVATPLGGRKTAEVRDAWREGILDHPGDYLDARWDLFWRQVALTRKPVFIYHPVIDDSPLDFSLANPGLDRRARDYVEAFADPVLDGGIVHRVWIYLLLALAAAVVLLRRRAPVVLRCVGALGLAALTYQIGLFFLAMGVQYRLENPSVVIGLLCAAVLLRLAASEVQRRRSLARTS